MKKISAYILSLVLSLAVGAGTAFGGSVPAEPLPVESSASVKVQGTTVTVDNPTDESVDVAVFAITGTMVRHITVEPGCNAEIELSAGIYVVRAGKHSQKVAIR